MTLQAQIKTDYVKKHLGTFDDIKSAVKARRKAEIKYWGKNYDIQTV